METIEGKIEAAPDANLEEKKISEDNEKQVSHDSEENKALTEKTQGIVKLGAAENEPKNEDKLIGSKVINQEINTPAKFINLSNIEAGKESSGDAPSSPKIFVRLKSPVKDSFRKSPLNMEIADSLHERNLQKEAKITTMRLKKKANEIGQMRSVPEINSKSKKIAEKSGKIGVLEANSNLISKNEVEEKDSFCKIIQDAQCSPGLNQEKSQTLTKGKALKESDRQAGFDNSELIRTAVKLRDSLPSKSPEPQKPVLDVVKKGEILRKKKAQKIKEAEEKKKAHELDGCTFKPTLLSKNQISDSGSFVIHQSQSTKALKKKNPSESSEPKVLTRLEYEERYELAQAKLYDPKYVPISPVNYHIKYQIGYNEDHLIAKAQPMVDYRIVGNLLE